MPYTSGCCDMCTYSHAHPLPLFIDKIKDLLIAKIAMQCSDLYADAYSSMQVGSVKPIWDKVSTYMHMGVMKALKCKLSAFQKLIIMY